MPPKRNCPKCSHLSIHVDDEGCEYCTWRVECYFSEFGNDENRDTHHECPGVIHEDTKRLCRCFCHATVSDEEVQSTARQLTRLLLSLQ